MKYEFGSEATLCITLSIRPSLFLTFGSDALIIYHYISVCVCIRECESAETDKNVRLKVVEREREREQQRSVENAEVSIRNA